MKRIATTAAVLALLCAAGSRHAHAQSGRVIGQVTDHATGQPVEGAKVVLRHTAMGLKSKGETNDKGAFHIMNVRFGAYDVTVEKDGYNTFTATMNVEPISNDATVIKVELGANALRETPPQS